ncbi:glutamate decarboxylase [Humibacter sp. RRB41]|uniref:glutamate decarboxylase n=1 Tax=Humibacter sp. RRB41 TaxID=2919946 RepID=UPI001FAAFF80|nr:glutamate decarboxylase [Humibacter sp. RRB41]
MDDGIDDVFAGAEMVTPAPKTEFPKGERPAKDVYQLVRDELLLDGVARMNLATFCTTWLEPEAEKLMADSIAKNIIDKDEYPQTAEIERRCVALVADLFHAPDPAHAVGTSTTGSSEAAMLAGLAAKWRWRAKRRAANADSTRPNLVCGSVQVCWEKFARYFDVELRQVPMPEGYLLTPEDAVAHCDENTIAVVATFGQTFTGLFEDVSAISAALDDLQGRTGLDIPLHVDAASGGFVAPFCAPDVVWDFRLPRVKSINASGHKTGLAPLGSGWAIWREPADLPDELVFDVNYLGGDMPTFTLNFSRPGGQVITSYYTFLRLGRNGYTKVQSAAYTVAQRIAAGIRSFDRFDMVFDGDPLKGIPAVTWTARGDDALLFDLAQQLRMRGWLVPAYTLPPDRQSIPVQRVVVRHGMSVDMADLLLADIRRSLDELSTLPGGVHVEAANSTGFNHNATPRIAHA